MSAPLVPPQPVLVDDDVWPEFHDAIRSLGGRWTAPSGRAYLLELDGRRMVVATPPSGDLSAEPPGTAIDDDLLALGQAIYDAMGGEWAAVRLAQLVDVWSGGQ
jgi:hypothetical protein